MVFNEGFLPIDPEWVAQSTKDAIHLNYDESPIIVPPKRELPRKEVPFTLPMAEPLNIRFQSDQIEEQILEIMLSGSVRRGSKNLVVPFRETFLQKIRKLKTHDQPISFVLPSLPFKDQSPFTTDADIDHTDLGEYAFFAQLKRILEAIKTIYPPGGHMTVLCDGYIYADIFANDNKEGAGKYKAKCEQIRTDYGLFNEVTLFDMREVLFDQPEYNLAEQQIRDILRALYQQDQKVKEHLDVLARRFVFHVQLPGYDYETAREMYAQEPWPNEVTDLLLESAIKYAALHLTLKKTDLVSRAFPSQLRCTVHPKAAAQLPLHLTHSGNTLLPYNGVATVSREKMGNGQSLFNALRVKKLAEVFENEDVTAVYTNKAKDPFYYELP